jgi:hypothetical protein
MKNLLLLLFLLARTCTPPRDITGNPPNLEHDFNKKMLPLGGNAWIAKPDSITDQGLLNWSNPNAICKTYLKIPKVGKLRLSLFLNTNGGKSTINVTFLHKSIEIKAEGNGEKEYFLGEWLVEKTGYEAIQIQGIEKSGQSFGTISNIGFSGTAVSSDLSFVQNNEGNYFYWGRRGPSVHLNYKTDADSIEWFYNEITVPKGNDVIGSYYMADGFAEGYFGFQVNSATERNVLFSVWSPFETDDPNAIPEDYKIIPLKKGKDVHQGEFGAEGSGGQSYLRYPWKAGETYRFLLKGKPSDNNSSIFTAYFFAPEENKWRLIASFKRPHTSTYLTKLHSFLENFEPEMGNITRMALYSNQWVRDATGHWSELNEMRFSGDQTAHKNFRKDYAGGIQNEQFYLKNCGFFDEFTELNQNFSRPLNGKVPEIDFSKLEKLK